MSMTREQAAAAAQSLKTELAKIIVGQEQVIDEILIALAAGGHALLEGVPGLAKTLLISSLAKSTELSFSRIQFTPDLMPADITGTEVIRENRATGDRELAFLPGPVFAQVILADEINRTPPKTQAALLEAMQERQVSAGGEIRPLPQPFFVLATQNPIEQEGTYTLPEAQLDRFLLKIMVSYPSEEEELQVILRTTGAAGEAISPVLDGNSLLRLQELVRATPVAESVVRYALALARGTRPEADGGHPEITKLLRWGAGPRAGQSLVLCAKARATLTGRAHVGIDDIRDLAKPIMRHRIQTSYEADARGFDPDQIVDRLLEVIDVPPAAAEGDPAIAGALN